MTIEDFLLARIAEDEAAASAKPPGAFFERHTMDYRASEADGFGYAWTSRFRVLAECAAKRRIVELHQPDDDKCSVCSHEIGYASDGYGGEYYENHRTGNDWPCATLRAIAAVYSDHPDYREDWTG